MDSMKILSKNLYEENQEYFEELIKNIDMVIMPKSLNKMDADTKFRNQRSIFFINQTDKIGQKRYCTISFIFYKHFI